MSENPVQRSLRILLVDDSQEDRAELRRMLLTGSDQRYQFSEADTGAQTLVVCLESAEGPPDCVFLDYHLPDYDAPELLLALGGPNLPCCPVVVVTGLDNSPNASAILRLGAQDFIGKAWINPESLTRSLENAIERFAMSRALEEKEERLRLALEAARMGVLEWDITSGQLIWNSRTEEIYGYRSGEFDGTYATFASRIHPEDLPTLERKIARCKEERTHYSQEHRHIWPDGSLRWVAARAVFSYDDNGEPTRLLGTIVDITEQKANEKALTESQERLALAAQHNGVGIWDWNLRTLDLVWDDSMYALYHMNPADFSGAVDAWEKSLHPDDRERAEREIQAALAGEKPFDTEFRVGWPNGEVRHIKAVAKVFRDENEAPVRMLGTNIDITELKQAQTALLETEALRIASRHTRNLIETSMDPMVIISPEGNITDVNAATEQVTGYPRDALIGTEFGAYFADSMAARAGYQQAFATGSVHDYALDMRHRDGHVTPVLYNAAVYRDEAGNIAGVFAAARDITEQQRASEISRELYHRLTHIASRVPGVIYQYKLRPDGSSCFPYASEAIRDIYRVTPEAVLEDASAVFANLHSDDYDGIVASIQHSAATLQPWQYEYRVRFADGTIRWLQGNALPEKETDGSVLWHGFITDITEIKQTEQTLRESENKFSKIFHDSPIGMAISSAADGKIMDANAAFLNLYGYGREEILGRSSVELGLWDDLKQRERIVNNVLRDGLASNFEVNYHRNADPTDRTLLASIDTLEIAGETCLVSFILDITDRRRAKDFLQESERKYRRSSQRLSQVIWATTVGT